MRLALALLLTTSVFAQRPPDMTITAEERGQLIAKAADLLEREYVDEQKGRDVAAALRAARFDGITSALELVPAVNRVFKSAGDAHLRFGYDHEKEAPEDGEADRRAVAKNAYGVHGVALAAGFCDQSHFTNAFRRLFGVTPAEYRRASGG
jgi:AraC-like DNA-binding protein